MRLLFVEQKEHLNRGSELTVVHESLLEEDNADEADALLAGTEKVLISVMDSVCEMYDRGRCAAARARKAVGGCIVKHLMI